MVTALAVLWVPLCCCNLRPLAAAFLGRVADGTPHGASGHAPEHRGRGCHHCRHDGPRPAEEPSDSPDHDHGDCCGGHHKIGVLPERPAIPADTMGQWLAVPGLTLAALLPGAERPAPPARPDSTAPRRPSTSLLRLHCALIV